MNLFLKKDSVALVLLLFFACGCKKNDTSGVTPPIQYSEPNIVFFLADDFGTEIPGCYGGQSYQTPNIDLMAANGMRFTQCFSSPLCSPSRIMLLTGKYSFRNYTSWGRLGSDQKTFGNMLRDAGYNTCLAGKWQINGGDNVIKNFGFDNYCLWDVIGEDDDKGSRYKTPHIYENGQYLPTDSTLNKYSEDIFTDYIVNFLRNNKGGKKPFFVYYPFCLTHNPFTPTPVDSDFATWDPDRSDPKFFPSMVKYMDKKIGQIITEIKSDGLESNTVFLFSGDNGTSSGITSLQNGHYIQGGKGLTIEAGTHVPLIVYWPGKVKPSVNNNLIDFTDFLPTLAGIAGVSEPANYGTLDGLSFYPQLINQSTMCVTGFFVILLHIKQKYPFVMFKISNINIMKTIGFMILMMMFLNCLPSPIIN